MAASNFPNGFSQGVTIRGVPILNTHSGKVYWVDSNGSYNDNYAGTYDKPFSSLALAAAYGKLTAGDIIVIKAGHAETVAGAAGINLSDAGVAVVGLGVGNNRPTFTFSATASTITLTAANIAFLNCILKPSIDSVVSPIVVSAAGCVLDLESQDASATVEFVNVVLTTAAADNLDIKLKHLGFITGNAGINAIRLVGCNNADIEIDYYGIASTAVVEFHTTACSNIAVTGTIYNESAALTKNVVDTVTGSTWTADLFDGKGGYHLSGGSAAALAADDVGAVTTAIAAVPKCIAKTDGSVPNNTTDDLFTIAGGPVRCKITGVVTTVIGGAANGKLQFTSTTPAATVDLSAGAVAIDADAAGTVYQSVGATAVFTPSTTLGYALADPVTVEETEFILTPGTVKFHASATQTGVIAWYMTFTPMSPSATVTAAA